MGNKTKMKTREFEITFGGTLGNFVLKHDHKLSGPMNDQKLEEIQDNVYNYCDLTSLYLTEELLKEDNILNQLDLNLERFVTDVDYYYWVFDHKRTEFNMIIDWFMEKVGPVWNDLNQWFFGRPDFDNDDELKNMMEVMNFGLNHYPKEKISDENMWDDLLICIKEDEDWDIKSSIMNVKKREHGFKGDVLDRDFQNRDNCNVEVS